MDGVLDAGDGGVPGWNADGCLEVGVGEVAAARRAGLRFRLIDCREEEEHAICRLEGAELVPLSRFAGLAPGRLVDPGEVVVIFCHHGMRSIRAAECLRAKGHPMAFSMAGGIDLWSREVDPGVPRY